MVRGSCLGLLVLCAALWTMSYFYTGTVSRKGSSTILVGVQGGVGVLRAHSIASVLPPGWSAQWHADLLGNPFSLHLSDRDFLGFGVVQRLGAPVWVFVIPLWFPTVLLALLSWVAWYKTVERKPAQGFPVEPQTRPQEAPGS